MQKDVKIRTFYRHAPVAQLDRVPPSEGGGHRFESCRVRHFPFKFSILPKPSDLSQACCTDFLCLGLLLSLFLVACWNDICPKPLKMAQFGRVPILCPNCAQAFFCTVEACRFLSTALCAQFTNYDGAFSVSESPQVSQEARSFAAHPEDKGQGVPYTMAHSIPISAARLKHPSPTSALSSALVQCQSRQPSA